MIGLMKFLAFMILVGIKNTLTTSKMKNIIAENALLSVATYKIVD